MKSIYKKILLIGLVSAIFEIALTQFTYAQVAGYIDSLGTSVITKASQAILVIFTWVAQKFFMLGGSFIELGMNLNNTILDPAKNVFLFKGWTVFVNVADLALVIALIVIAFATMLNFESYGMKKALVPLIVISLLVNFSLVIPGVLIDFSGMVTEFFVQQSGLSGGNITSALASGFDISGFLSTKSGATSIAGAMDKFGSGILSIIGSMVFIIIFTLIASVIMMTIAAMLFIRYFTLTFLLVLTPIVFVSRIFPSTRSHWDKWWNDFVRWTMFPPVMIFFMWLSLTSLNAFDNPAPTAAGSGGNATYAFGDGLLFTMSSVVQAAMAIMFMMMSLIAANSISLKGAKGSKDMISNMSGWSKARLEKMGKGTQAYVRRETERGARRMGARGAAAGIAGAGYVAKKYGVSAADLRKMEAERKPGVMGWAKGRTAGALGRAGQAISQSQQAALKKAFDEKFKGMSDDSLAGRYATMATDEKFFAQQQLAKGGNLGKINEKILDADIMSTGATGIKGQFDGIGGAGAYAKLTKAAGRNAEMLTAQKGVDAANALPPGVAKTDAIVSAKKKYQEEAKKFFDSFAEKDRVALGFDFYDKGKYGKEALQSLMMNDPRALASLTKGIGKGPEVKKFMGKIEGIGAEIKQGVIDGIKATKGAEIAGATNKELVSVMKELKATNEDIAKTKDIKEMLTWIEEHDAKAYKNLGGERVLNDIEAQMKMLHARDSADFSSMKKESEDYQHIVRMQDSMRKSGASRLYTASKEEEKKA
ncbi:MAG: hypothetical protein UY31_C0033G0004 [Candidatus Wolfebacteria bacterium GW2011_GWE1_48_7]|uniref:Uncharacterized protein n=2 Tax=Candidatus Wolfeibacteriota TaxID=1752735 RepID=A0A0G1U6L1_9BACT|nr:MAG: hypothetical protein UX70_C0001G0907 [Candidatus Wolfebacteria bacterium GW2011_GWB1_47_1]KKU35818.1 MAG: hypothetical protein UX49_C0024G0004 [Candidatus Wolfebacteria bacterium GW2011_GWC2_46_275]KKU42192.1 MAG: hypothetical protein UX58_C0003G0117 [Candidatus Wolfebacteria bacterium GW2011_GWB2_46_69]KKU53814.1 MAG: hypothetical protein UX76_C0009G0004 [Candidatus Wolfebacteria bacterium GW2011_GWC1_47_103]KKU59457.1 MAG: hypothetical protein UX83_C0005G0076 [Candidatus Wolfebacteria